MDKLRDDLRVLYSRQQAELGDMHEARQRVIRVALADRDEPVAGRLHFAAGIAAVLLAALVVGTFAYIRAGGANHVVAQPKVSPLPTAVPMAGPKTHPAPAGYAILDTAPLDALSGSVLLSNCVQPITSRCHYSIVRTTNGGQTWSKPVQIGPSSNGSDAGVPRRLTFINANDGFEYGSTAAYVTHDGGRTWKPVSLHPSWFGLIEGRGTTAWVISYPCPKGKLCPFDVRSSVDAGRTWTAPQPLPVGFSPDYGTAIAENGLLLSAGPTGNIEITLDRGITWSLMATPCPESTMRSVVTTQDGIELWDLCQTDAKPGSSKLFISTDGGRSWAARNALPPTIKQLPLDFSTMLVATRARTAVMASGLTSIAITHDGGLTWATVGPEGFPFGLLRFANATDGWVLDFSERLWTTSDGGDHWR
jgi:photosystem II stability/assembly factor-like uncharacterized protein